MASGSWTFLTGRGGSALRHLDHARFGSGGGACARSGADQLNRLAKFGMFTREIFNHLVMLRAC